MKKKEKIALCILVPLAIISGIIAVVLGFYEKEEPEEIVFPKSSLSESIFDSQNMEYVANENFSNTHAFVYEPYTVDTITTNSAVVDTGCVYDSGSFYFYYSELKKEESTKDVVRAQMSKILKYDAEDEETFVEVLSSDTGFINGFSADYEIDRVSVDDNGVVNSVYLILYRLKVADSDDYEDNYDIIIGVATKVYTNEALNNAKQLLDVNLLTVQYNKNTASEMIEQLEREARQEAENEKTEKKKEESEKQDNSSEQETDSETEEEGTESVESTEETITEETVNYSNDEPSASTNNDNNASKTMGILLKKDYNDLTVKVVWTNTEQEPSLTLCNVDGSNEISPESSGDGQAVFHIGEAKAGVYIVNIENGADCGGFTAELIEN